MKIYDCFMFFDEEMILDLRLNVLNEYVDKFVINESRYFHSGKPKKLVFDINKYSKFKDKIIHNIIDKPPPNIETIYEEDTNKEDIRGQKLVNNSNKREHYQREMIGNSLDDAEPNDIILSNDVDEIPNLEGINFNEIKEKIISMGVNKVDYIKLIDLKTLKKPRKNKFNLFYALYIGKVRLIDNF